MGRVPLYEHKERSSILAHVFFFFFSYTYFICPDQLLNLFTNAAARWYCDEDGELVALQRAFRLLRVLLLHADPALALRLDACDMPPALYAAPWLLTLFSRNLELPLVNR
jgi:Rab-GTPase-TBC domain